MPDPVEQIRSVLVYRSAEQALDIALDAARQAGRKVFTDHRGLPPAEQLAMALQAADKVLEGLGMALAEAVGAQ